MDKKRLYKHRKEQETYQCAYCKKDFTPGDLDLIACAIRRQQPTCSEACFVLMGYRPKI